MNKHYSGGNEGQRDIAGGRWSRDGDWLVLWITSGGFFAGSRLSNLSAVGKDHSSAVQKRAVRWGQSELQKTKAWDSSLGQSLAHLTEFWPKFRQWRSINLSHANSKDNVLKAGASTYLPSFCILKCSHCSLSAFAIYCLITSMYTGGKARTRYTKYLSWWVMKEKKICP